MENPIIHYQDVDVVHEKSVILQHVQWDISQGDFVYLLGSVGSGKSSLLKTLYGEIPIKNGIAEIFDYDLRKIKRRQLPHLRKKIGIVFQDFQLLADRSVYQNLLFVLKATGWKNKKEMADQVVQVLEQVGMEHARNKFPHQLSGGEQQRVAIARALLNSPELILADEPTGNVDFKTGEKLMRILYEIHQAGTTVIVATHFVQWVELFPGRVFNLDAQLLTEQSTWQREAVKDDVEWTAQEKAEVNDEDDLSDRYPVTSEEALDAPNENESDV
ncbi:MAG: cell division ATP-binding protein FtsE [Microbacter sp.]